jgi:MoxR-like ATPase
LWEIAPQLSLRLARFGVGVDVRLEAGPAVQLWDVAGVGRTRVAARAAAALEWPLAQALSGSLRVSGLVSGSVFDAGETPPDVERRATRRLGVAVGARYRL